MKAMSVILKRHYMNCFDTYIYKVGRLPTRPSGSTSSRCRMWPWCRPLNTNWPGEFGLSRTRKSPS